MTIKYLRMRIDDDGGSGSVSIPREEDPQQEVLDIIGESGWSLREWANGDTYLFNPNPPAQDIINVKLNVHSFTVNSTKASLGDPFEAGEYLGENAYINLDNSTMEREADRIREVANPEGANLGTLTQDEMWDVAWLAFRWAPYNMDYTTGLGETGASDRAFNQGIGDCTEYAASAVALLRENGMQARLVKGWWDSNGDGVLPESDSPTHIWYEAYLPDQDGNGWHWFQMDNQLWNPNRSTNTYGFGFGGDDKIALGQYGEGAYTSSGVDDVDYWTNLTLIS
jgi:transglutaminase-like putative cysteine protease